MDGVHDIRAIGSRTETTRNTDHQEDALGREPMAVFGRWKVECTPECFSSKRSIAEKNPTVVYAPAYSSSRKSGRAVGLVAESRG